MDHAVPLHQRVGMAVALTYVERAGIEAQFGAEVREAVDASVLAALCAGLPDARVVSRNGRMMIFVRQVPRPVESFLGRARAAVEEVIHRAGDTDLRVTPLLAFSLVRRDDTRAAWDRAHSGLEEALSRLDLVPVERAHVRTPRPVSLEGVRRRVAAKRLVPERWRLRVQVILSFVLALGVPYAGYETAGALGIGQAVTRVAYAVICLSLLLTAATLYAECLAALEPGGPPPADGQELPTATAIIAAYLPNEAATISETVQAFLDLDYAGGLQVILAYNTPEPLPVEDDLRAWAERDDRLVVFRVDHSTSKAQNVNAALAVASGDVIGIFDADHHPAPGSFERAWRWLAAGYGVVQGHCVIRNGDDSWVSRMVAVEFESIYAVNHPGRAQVQGFGIFGGSNGYWRADLLRRVRLRGTMLTEDIDSSLRVTLRGERIASDPGLISRELAPTTLRVLTGQRLRWAQGWSQVSLRYMLSTLTSRRLSLRQKLGSVFLLGWREVSPWMSLQMIPLVAYVLLHPGRQPFHWFVPLLVLATIVTTLAGPFQAVITWVCAVPEIRRHRRWFVGFTVLNAVFYTEYKNCLARVAHLKHLSRETTWRVTARDAGAATAPAGPTS